MYLSAVFKSGLSGMWPSLLYGKIIHINSLLLWLSISGLQCAVPGGTHRETKSYTGHHLIRFIPQNKEQLKLVRDLQAEHRRETDFWIHPNQAERPVDMRVSPEVVDEILSASNQTGLLYDVISADIDRLVVGQRSRRAVVGLASAADPGNTSSSVFDLTEYHTYTEIESWLEQVNHNCDFCEVIDIGETFEGRRMKLMKIGSGSSHKPAIWIDAGLHAREWIAPATALYIIDKLTSRVPDRVTSFLLSKYTWYVLAVANPDGYAYTWTTDRLWRKTRSVSANPRTDGCVGVDPNRNWDFHWSGEGTSDNPCDENYHGPLPFSEIETENMASALMSVKEDLAVYLSLHSYGQYWLTPWGYTTSLPSDYQDMIRLGKRAANSIRRSRGTVYQVGSSARMLYLAAGGSDDWVKAELGVKYAYTVELKDTGHHGFLLPPRYISSTAREMVSAIKTLGMAVLRERRRAAREQRAPL